MLGSHNNSSGAEVFQCILASCGYFYHPECVAFELYASDQYMTEQRITKISFGVPFICPLHKCQVCDGKENKVVHELRFAVCRRCLKAYHPKCLPTQLVSPLLPIEVSIKELGIIFCILMYCMRHEIVPILDTPLRNHLSFSMHNKGRGPVNVKEIRSRCLGNLEQGETVKSGPLIEGYQCTCGQANPVNGEPRLKTVKEEPVIVGCYYTCDPIKAVKQDRDIDGWGKTFQHPHENKRTPL